MEHAWDLVSPYAGAPDFSGVGMPLDYQDVSWMQAVLFVSIEFVCNFKVGKVSRVSQNVRNSEIRDALGGGGQ